VRLLAPGDEAAKQGESRTSARVAEAESLLAAGTEMLEAGDPESAVARLTEANAVLPGDPLVEGRIKEANRHADDLKKELAAIESDAAKGRAETAAPRLSALAERYPKARNVLEALSRAEKAGREANRGAARERLAKALAAAKAHEDAKRLRDAAQSWREAATLDPDSAEAQEGVARVERMLAEFDAILGQARNLLSSGDPEGAERAATEALAVISGDPAGEAQLARARTGVETLRHEAERIRTALAGEADDDVLTWARELAASYSGSALAAEVLRETEGKFKEAEDKATEKRVSGPLERAKKLESDGNLGQALKSYEDVLRVAPDHAEAKASAARITSRFDRARSRAADAKALLEAGDPDGARAAAEESIGLHAEQRETAGTLAGARAALAEIDRAAASFAEVAAVDRATQQLERLKRLEAKYPKAARCSELVARAVAALAAAQLHARAENVRQHADEGRRALDEGRLADAERACEQALAIDPSDAAAKETREAALERGRRARALLAEGAAALRAHKHAEARDRFAAALAADPLLADAAKGRDEATAAIEKAAAEIAQAVERAASLARAGSPPEAIRAWEKVLALDATNSQAPAEIARLKTRLEKATADTARGRASLNAGDPESAVSPLEAARAVMGPGEAEALLATARDRAAEIAKTIRQVETALAAGEGALDGAEKAAAALAAKFPGSARAKEVAQHAASAALERRRTMAVTQVRKLVRERRFGEARDLAASLRAEGVRSSELDAAAAQAEQAITKLDSLRTRAADARKAGRLTEARDALQELLVALPDDAGVKAELTELEETIREVTARRDAADSARRRGAITQAIELYREALALQGKDEALEAEIEKLTAENKERSRLLDACHKAVKRGDGKACAESARQLLDRYPEDDDARDLHTTGESMEKIVTALLARAQRLAAAGDRDAAAETAECLLRIAPGHAKAKALVKA
jgi:tetratricopeptide (TPR) repeat protein